MRSFLLGYRRLGVSLGLASLGFCRLIRKPGLLRVYSMLMFLIILLFLDTCSLSASFLFRAVSEAPDSLSWCWLLGAVLHSQFPHPVWHAFFWVLTKDTECFWFEKLNIRAEARECVWGSRLPEKEPFLPQSSSALPCLEKVQCQLPKEEDVAGETALLMWIAGSDIKPTSWTELLVLLESCGQEWSLIFRKCRWALVT